MKPNRVVAVAGALISLALALLPVIANFDWRSTAGAIAGIVAVLGIVQKFLDGWQAHEERVWKYDPTGYVEASLPVAPAPAAPDQGDIGA